MAFFKYTYTIAGTPQVYSVPVYTSATIPSAFNPARIMRIGSNYLYLYDWADPLIGAGRLCRNRTAAAQHYFKVYDPLLDKTYYAGSVWMQTSVAVPTVSALGASSAKITIGAGSALLTTVSGYTPRVDTLSLIGGGAGGAGGGGGGGAGGTYGCTINAYIDYLQTFPPGQGGTARGGSYGNSATPVYPAAMSYVDNYEYCILVGGGGGGGAGGGGGDRGTDYVTAEYYSSTRYALRRGYNGTGGSGGSPGAATRLYYRSSAAAPWVASNLVSAAGAGLAHSTNYWGDLGSVSGAYTRGGTGGPGSSLEEPPTGEANPQVGAGRGGSGGRGGLYKDNTDGETGIAGSSGSPGTGAGYLRWWYEYL